VECPLGTGTPTNISSVSTECVVIPCDPCGEENPDLYLTAALSIYKQPAWTTTIPPGTNSAELMCTLNSTDPAICGPALGCVTNDIAIDNQGNYIVLGRRSSSGAGWVIKVDAESIVPGEPCPITVLLGNLAQPWAGLGAAPRSDLFYGIGQGQVFTVQVQDDDASIIGSVSNSNFTGAADVTAGPDGNIYAIVGTAAYLVPVDANYIPTGTPTMVASGGLLNGAAAFCTSSEPYAVSGTNKNVFEFLDQTSFTRVGGSGFNVAGDGVTGAATAPVCGFP